MFSLSESAVIFVGFQIIIHMHTLIANSSFDVILYEENGSGIAFALPSIWNAKRTNEWIGENVKFWEMEMKGRKIGIILQAS